LTLPVASNERFALARVGRDASDEGPLPRRSRPLSVSLSTWANDHNWPGAVSCDGHTCLQPRLAAIGSTRPTSAVRTSATARTASKMKRSLVLSSRKAAVCNAYWKTCSPVPEQDHRRGVPEAAAVQSPHNQRDGGRHAHPVALQRPSTRVPRSSLSPPATAIT
jgi:hypothetical protein